MDDPWRMRSMGSSSKTKLPNCPHRRSTGTTTYHRRKQPDSSGRDPNDFSDVFGGPPRIILSRQFSYNDSRTPSSSSSKFSFYEDIFRPPESVGKSSEKGGRSLPEFRIPGQVRKTGDGFYSDIFGCGEDHEDYNDVVIRSKASSSSVLSSPEISPLKPLIYRSDDGDDDDDVSSLTTKLRPLNVRTRLSSSRKIEHDDDFNRGKTSFASKHQVINDTENDHHFFNDNLKSYGFGLSRYCASPETVSLEPISTRSFKLSADDLENKSSSSSSDASLICRRDAELRMHEIEDEQVWRKQMLEHEQAEQEDEVINVSSYVIEISSDLREGSCESNNDIDEAIAWAKEKFRQSCSKELNAEDLNKNQLSEGCTDSLDSSDVEQNNGVCKGGSDPKSQFVENQILLDEKIRLWSSGKEGDIRLLLSSLHHILWPNSGWSPRSIADLIENSQVKKAYQKATLCLHPDKLQQRGATRSHKYIADKAFSVLQDAWTEFVSQSMACR